MSIPAIDIAVFGILVIAGGFFFKRTSATVLIGFAIIGFAWNLR